MECCGDRGLACTSSRRPRGGVATRRDGADRASAEAEMPGQDGAEIGSARMTRGRAGDAGWNGVEGGISVSRWERVSACFLAAACRRGVIRRRRRRISRRKDRALASTWPRSDRVAVSCNKPETLKGGASGTTPTRRQLSQARLIRRGPYRCNTTPQLRYSACCR